LRAGVRRENVVFHLYCPTFVYARQALLVTAWSWPAVRVRNARPRHPEVFPEARAGFCCTRDEWLERDADLGVLGTRVAQPAGPLLPQPGRPCARTLHKRAASKAEAAATPATAVTALTTLSSPMPEGRKDQGARPVARTRPVRRPFG